MCCGMLDDYEFFPNADHLDGDARWITLHILGRGVAIDEGLLVPYEFEYDGEVVRVCFTDRLYAKYAVKPHEMKRLAETALTRLDAPHKRDNEYLKRRVVDDALVVQDRYGVVFMTPDDW